MDSVESALLIAWEKVYRRLLIDSDERDRRLARRRSRLLQRPPRAWCLALRASDTRIHPGSALITPEFAAYPGSPDRLITHEVALTAPLIRNLHEPVRLPPGEDMQYAAKQLGVHLETLRYSMRTGRFHVVYYKGLEGRRGKPVPTLQPRRRMFLPSTGVCADAPDPVWGTICQQLAHMLPDTFEQTLTRTPLFRDYPSRTGTTTRRFRGWRWICPSCHKPVRTVLLPLPPLSLPEYYGQPFPYAPRPSTAQGERHHSSFDIPDDPPAFFACTRCHHIRYFTRTSRDGWNQFVAYASAGLLYGHEVPMPYNRRADSSRKRAYRPYLMRPPSRRREQVLERLLKNMTYDQIAADLGVGYSIVHGHVKVTYKQHGVHSLSELADKLDVRLISRANPKRDEIRNRLAAGESYRQIARAMDIGYYAVNYQVKQIRREEKSRRMEPRTQAAPPM